MCLIRLPFQSYLFVLGHFVIREKLTQLPAIDLKNVKVNWLSMSHIYQQRGKNSGRVGQVTNTRDCSNIIDV